MPGSQPQARVLFLRSARRECRERFAAVMGSIPEHRPAEMLRRFSSVFSTNISCAMVGYRIARRAFGIIRTGSRQENNFDSASGGERFQRSSQLTVCVDERVLRENPGRASAGKTQRY